MKLTALAQIYNQIVTVLVQLLLVPVLLLAWGSSIYGGWLILAAIPTYLTLSDLGFTYVAKNEMSIKVASGDRSGALVIYQSVFFLLSIIGFVLFVFAALFVTIFDLSRIFDLGGISALDAKISFIALVGNVIIYQFLMLDCAGMRCIGRPATEVMWASTARLAEGVVTGVVAYLGGRVAFACCAILISRLTIYSLSRLWLQRQANWLSLGFRMRSATEIRRLFAPSFGAMGVSLANAMLIQSPVLILGAISTSTNVVIFTTARTLTRLGTSASSVLAFSVAPEYSVAFGKKKFSRFRALLKFHMSTNISLIAVYLIAMFFLADMVVKIWMHDVIHVPHFFLLLMMVAVAFEMLWTSLFIPLVSITRHVLASNWFLCLSAITCLLSYFGIRSYGLDAAAIALISLHVIMCGIIYGVWAASDLEV